MKKKGLFEEKVDRCRQKKLDELIHNASWEHALYLVKNLIEDAKDGEAIRIVSGTFNVAFYGQLKDLLQEKMDQGHPVYVVITEADPEEDHPVVQLLCEHENGHLQIVAPENRPFARAPHLILIGERAFRLETDHAQTKAVASFNSPDMAETLQMFFDLAWNAANPQEAMEAA